MPKVKKTFMVNGLITVSVQTEVNAFDEKEAKELALQKSVMPLPYMSVDPQESWVVYALDGEVHEDVDVVELKEKK